MCLRHTASVECKICRLNNLLPVVEFEHQGAALASLSLELARHACSGAMKEKWRDSDEHMLILCKKQKVQPTEAYVLIDGVRCRIVVFGVFDRACLFLFRSFFLLSFFFSFFFFFERVPSLPQLPLLFLVGFCFLFFIIEYCFLTTALRSFFFCCGQLVFETVSMPLSTLVQRPVRRSSEWSLGTAAPGGLFGK